MGLRGGCGLGLGLGVLRLEPDWGVLRLAIDLNLGFVIGTCGWGWTGLGWAGLGWEGGGAGAAVLRLEPDFLKLGFATGN